MLDSHKAVETRLTFLIIFIQGAKKVSFTACYFGKLYLACTSLKAILTIPIFFTNGIDYSSSVI